MYQPRLVTGVKKNLVNFQQSRSSWLSSLFKNPGTSQQQQQQSATKQEDEAKKGDEKLSRLHTDKEQPAPRKKTTSQMDEELRQKMAGLSGDGGEAGVELENGQPVAMKRSVKNNMFRYI